MPTPVQEQIMAALAAKLEAISAVAGLTVERERIDPVPGSSLPFLALYEADLAPGDLFAGEDAYTLSVSIEGLATGADELAARQAAAILRAEAQKAVMSDRTLGALCRDLRPAQEPPPPQLEPDVPEHVAGFQLAFEVLFATAEGNPYSQP